MQLVRADQVFGLLLDLPLPGGQQLGRDRRRQHVAQHGGQRVAAAGVGVIADHQADDGLGHEELTGVKFTLSKTDTGLRIDALGIPAHAASPDAGRNAQTALLGLLSDLPLHDSPCARAIRALHELFPYGDNEGRAIGVAQKDDISGALTLVFSVFKLNETGCEGCYDSRTPLCATWENMFWTSISSCAPTT